MSSQQKRYAIAGLVVSILACIGTWLAIPQVYAALLNLLPSQEVTTASPTSTTSPKAVSTALITVHKEASEMEGGNHKFRPPGSPVSTDRYGGLTAVTIYGIESGRSTITTTFEMTRSTGLAQLTIVGMDDEKNYKTQLLIVVNGHEVYRGEAPFPNDDYPFETARYAPYTWIVDPSYLQVGSNTVTISNLSHVLSEDLPFFALHSLDIHYEIQR